MNRTLLSSVEVLLDADWTFKIKFLSAVGSSFLQETIDKTGVDD